MDDWGLLNHLQSSGRPDRQPEQRDGRRRAVGGIVRAIPYTLVARRYNGDVTDSAYTPLSEKQRKFLRGLAHALEPVVWIGNSGLTDGVVAEADRALRDHELIKVKIRASDRVRS